MGPFMSVERGSASKPGLDRVLREEADFANRDYAPHADQLEINPDMFRRYQSPTELWDWRQRSALLLGDIAGKDLLDLGCGMGEESIYFSKLGARVTAIDISEVGIASLRRRAAFHRVDIKALEMRAEATSFADASFDRIHGLGILHHIGIECGLEEVARLLRPGGAGVFLEPVGDSPTIEAVKGWLMKHGRFLADFDRITDHERNLTWREIERAVRRFPNAALYPYHLLYRVKRFLPARSLDAVRRFDAGLLTLVPQLRRYAGAVAIAVGRTGGSPVLDTTIKGRDPLQVSGGRERSRDAGRRERFVLSVLCVATFAGASCAGKGSVPFSTPSSADKPVVRERRDREERWRETVPMALFGAGLSYVGSRLRKRKV
jgi:SAM-dependent methyltransferase